MAENRDDSWSRALMATSGMSVGGSQRARPRAAEAARAADPDLPRDEMATLAKSRDPRTREAIAARPDCPLGVLISLAHDHTLDVRVAAASNPSAAAAVLEHLAKDRDAAVQKAVARNSATALELLESLGFSRREDVRRVATKSLDERSGGKTGADVAAATGGQRATAARAPELLDHAATSGVRGRGAEGSPNRAGDTRVFAPRPAVGRAAGTPGGAR